MNFHTLNIIWQNMTSPKRRMPKMPWDGQELLHIPYAAMSPSQYLDLYLPNTPGKKPLFASSVPMPCALTLMQTALPYGANRRADIWPPWRR